MNKKEKEVRKKENDTWNVLITTKEYLMWKNDATHSHTQAMKKTNEWKEWEKALKAIQSLVDDTKTEE